MSCHHFKNVSREKVLKYIPTIALNNLWFWKIFVVRIDAFLHDKTSKYPDFKPKKKKKGGGGVGEIEFKKKKKKTTKSERKFPYSQILFTMQSISKWNLMFKALNFQQSSGYYEWK